MSENVSLRCAATNNSGSIIVAISPLAYNNWPSKNKFPAPRPTFSGKRAARVSRFQWVFSNRCDSILFRLVCDLNKSGLFSTGAVTQKHRDTILSAASPLAVAPAKSSGGGCWTGPRGRMSAPSLASARGRFHQPAPTTVPPVKSKIPARPIEYILYVTWHDYTAF